MCVSIFGRIARCHVGRHSVEYMILKHGRVCAQIAYYNLSRHQGPIVIYLYMADVYQRLHAEKARHRPMVDRVLRKMETYCTSYDRSIVRVIWVVAALLAWMIVAGTVASSATTVEFNGTWDLSPAKSVELHQRDRTLHRVLRTMASRCDLGSDDVVLAPQVHVDNAPYMFRVLRICAARLELVNPTVAVTGGSTGTCVDEHGSIKKQSLRNFPITVHSDSHVPVTMMGLDEVCTFMHALSLLDATWSV